MPSDPPDWAGGQKRGRWRCGLRLARRSARACHCRNSGDTWRESRAPEDQAEAPEAQAEATFQRLWIDERSGSSCGKFSRCFVARFFNFPGSASDPEPDECDSASLQQAWDVSTSPDQRVIRNGTYFKVSDDHKDEVSTSPDQRVIRNWVSRGAIQSDHSPWFQLPRISE